MFAIGVLAAAADADDTGFLVGVTMWVRAIGTRALKKGKERVEWDIKECKTFVDDGLYWRFVIVIVVSS